MEADAAIQAVQFLLDDVDPTMPEPSIVPLVDGGVQIEWHQGGLDVEISFSDVEPGIYVEDHTTGASTEESLESAASLLSQYTSRITTA